MSNYLSKPKFKYGKLVSFFMVTLCFLFSQFHWNGQFISDTGASYANAIEAGEFWRLFTTLFVHGDMGHLLSNLLMLFILSYFVAAFFGELKTIIISVTLGALTNFVVLNLYEPQVTLVGASGIVYLLWGFWLIHYLCIQTQMSLVSRLLRVGAIFFILLIPTTYSPQTSYLAHYVGFSLGLIAGFLHFWLNRQRIKLAEQWDVRVVFDTDEYDDEEFQEIH